MGDYVAEFVARYDAQKSCVVLEMGAARSPMLSVFVVGEMTAGRMRDLTRKLFDLAAACWSPGQPPRRVRMVGLDEHGHAVELGDRSHELCGSRCVGGDPRTCGG